MPYARRYRKSTRPKRRYFTGRKYFNKRKYAASIPRRRLTDLTTYSFKRMVNLAGPQITTTSGSSIGGSYQFQLSDLPNSGEFTALFDSYRITGVLIKFIPRCTDQTSVNGAITSLGDFMFCTDYDDANVPGGASELFQRQSTRIVSSLTRQFKVFLRPRAATAVYNGTGFTAYAQTTKNQWIDVSNPAVPYYGLKWVWQNVVLPASTTALIDVIATYYVKFKSVR